MSISRRRKLVALALGTLLLAFVGCYAFVSLSPASARSFLLAAVNERLSIPVLADAITCEPSGVSFRERRRAFRCFAEIDCVGRPLKIVVFANLSHGPFLAGDPLSTRIFRRCPEVLKPHVREAEGQRVDQGG